MKDTKNDVKHISEETAGLAACIVLTQDFAVLRALFLPFPYLIFTTTDEARKAKIIHLVVEQTGSQRERVIAGPKISGQRQD